MGIVDSIMRGALGGDLPARDTASTPVARYDTKVIRIATRGPLGMKAPELRKLEKLLADGWEVVSQKGGFIGARMTTYVLRRPIR